MNQRVCIIQPVMKQYRVPFFEALAGLLAREGIDLQVVYGTPWAEEAKRNDHADLTSDIGFKVNSWMLGGKLLLIPVIRPWMSADLVVVEHANKNILNYLLALLSRLGLKRVAYWGHGRDRQADPDSRAERLKRRSLHWADWWFAYTADAASYVAGQGFDPARITTVQNAIDTRELRAQLAAVTESDRAARLREVGWPEGSRIGVYCGSLYENKRLDWLMQASEQVHARHPEFRLLIVGGGPQAGVVEPFAASRDWVKWVGPKFGRDKAQWLSLADMWLNPGLVGLGILDAFCARLPLLTTDLPLHSPEIEYLEAGRNGVMTAPDAQAFASAIESLLDDPGRLAAMQAAAEASSQRYSIEAMAENFAAGVRQCLGR